MRHYLFVLPILLCGCGGDSSDTTRIGPPPPVFEQRSDWARLMNDSAVVGTFVLWEPDSNRLQASDSVRALKGFLPASTFKIFNSLVALQTKAVADEHTIIPWDGIVRQNAGWNEDMDMTTAIQRSCVPWYQEVARRAGTDRMQHWLDTAQYGNRVIGDSIDLFWLQGGIRITPLQQVRFLERLNKEQLPFDVAYQRIVKRILPGDSTAVWRIRGKTGWAVRVDEEYGWYVGWVEHAGRTAYFAINIDMHGDLDARKRQELTRVILVKEGWLDKDAL